MKIVSMFVSAESKFVLLVCAPEIVVKMAQTFVAVPMCTRGALSPSVN